MNSIGKLRTGACGRFAVITVLIAVTGGWPSGDAVGEDKDDFIEIQHPKTLSVDKIPCERIPLGELEDYKPSMALLPSGELLLTMFNGYRKDDGKLFEQVLLHHSTDGGRTWSEAEKPDLPGREPSLSVLTDGTVFITTHLLAQEERNQDGYTHSHIHRLTDAGRNWTTTRVEPQQFRPRTTGLTSRNVLQLADGSILLGVSEHNIPNCKSFVWRSTDNGKTWAEKYPARFDSVPKDYQWTLFGEAHLWQARSGKIYAILRVGVHNSWPIAGTTDPGTNDNSERMVVYASTDMGRNWSKVRDLGDYGQMYMSILRVGDGRLLLTFTQRAITTPLGVRAILGRETEDGFDFDFEHDLLMLDTKTPVGMRSGGGFGPTLRLGDGTLITSYTWRDADEIKHAEVVRWRLPEPE